MRFYEAEEWIGDRLYDLLHYPPVRFVLRWVVRPLVLLAGAVAARRRRG